MKRRHFILSTLAALLPLNATSAPRSKNKKSTRKAVSKKRKTPPVQSAKKPTPKINKNTSYLVATPENSIIDHAISGTTTSHLPALKAPNLPNTWRSFHLEYAFTFPDEARAITIYCPLPSVFHPLYQQTSLLSWTGQTQAKIHHLWEKTHYFLELHAAPDGFFKRNVRDKVRIQVNTAIAMRRLNVAKRHFAPELEMILRHNLQSTAYIPTHGKVRKLALQIIGRIQDPLAQAKAIYDWISQHAHFSSRTQNGNAALQIESEIYKGNSDDLCALFVALCRSIGIPARSVYGIRVGQSKIVPELAQNTSSRNEFYIPGYGWIGVDLSAVLEAKAFSSRKDLPQLFFGLWENNWLALQSGENLLKNLSILVQPNAFVDNQALPQFAFQTQYHEIKTQG